MPPALGNVNGPIFGAINASTATNWPGSAYDPETHTVFAQAGNTGASARSLVAPPSGFSDIRYVSGMAGRPFREVFGPGDCCAADAGRRTAEERSNVQPNATQAPAPSADAATIAAANAGLTVEGLPIVKPPYGVLSALNLDRGELVWQVPHGETPDNIRNHPLLRGMNIPKTGQAGTSGVGLMVTKTIVVMGDPQVTSPPGRPRGAMLRAYDKRTGQEVGAQWLPAAQSGSPMSYSVDGRQFIIVAVAGGSYTGEYIAFALPQGQR
jgi:quinoprotein glucose dehydrogenase